MKTFIKSFRFFHDVLVIGKPTLQNYENIMKKWSLDTTCRGLYVKIQPHNGVSPVVKGLITRFLSHSQKLFMVTVMC